MKNVIVASNLQKHYGDFHALKGVSFAIREGECFGLLGHNGAGKSTTMKMIYGLSTVEEGSLTIFDQHISLTPPEIKHRLGVVPQEDNLDPDLPVIENLEVYAGLFGVSRHEARGREPRDALFHGSGVQRTKFGGYSFRGTEASPDHRPRFA